MLPRVFMDVSIDGDTVGRMEFELFIDVVPKTAYNFKRLCMGHLVPNPESTISEDGTIENACFTLSYEGSEFHRILPGTLVQGGILPERGDRSIFRQLFEDESFLGKAGVHMGFGTLAMASRGRNQNGSQFYICTGLTPWLDGEHVVFGRLVRGSQVLRAINQVETKSEDGMTPMKKIVITQSGEVKMGLKRTR